MKQIINSYDFHRAFETLRPNNFSYDALETLFNWFEDYEEGSGEEIELDVIAICCDWTESTLDEINQDYGRDYEDIDEALEALNDETIALLGSDDTIVYMAF